MTTVGHTLTGLTIAVLFQPKIVKIPTRIIYYLLFVFCALIPDIEVHGWGHYQYQISHSIVLMAALEGVIFLFSSLVPHLRKSRLYWRILLGCSVAWMSHFLLDSFYNHGKGIIVMWPISAGRLNLSLPWFSTIPPLPVSMEHIRICSVEVLFYLPLLLFAVLLKSVLKKRSLQHC